MAWASLSDAPRPMRRRARKSRSVPPLLGTSVRMGGFRYLLRSPTGHYLGEYLVAVPDWSEGDTVTGPGGPPVPHRQHRPGAGARRDPCDVDGGTGLAA